MTDEEKQIRLKLKNDLKHYASKCLKIKPKEGSLVSFVFNKAQQHIHERLEDQRRRMGRVRALVLKGRQQGCCYTPDMKVLTSDYRWLTLEEIQIGERIVACDEEGVGTTKTGKKHSRKFRTAIVEAKREFYKNVYEVLLDNGAIIKVTGDHRMLSRQRGGDCQVWRYISDFKIGDVIRVATRPPNYKSNYEDGWMGGIIDGEGSWHGTDIKRISIHQVAGPVLDRMKAYFKNIDMPYCEVIDKRDYGINKKEKKLVHRLDIHKLPYIIELFSRCLPTRFTNDEWYVGHELPGKAAKDGIIPWAKIISIKELGKKKVIDLQTSEKTYICEGLVSHNSTYVGARFYHFTTHNDGIQTFILTHLQDATNNLFKMAKRFYENTPDLVQPQVSTNNSKELNFNLLDSGYKIGTAENKTIGRSSTIHLFHGSEVAFWINASEHAKGIMQAVPESNGTEIILESTANGVGNYFHQMWQKAEAGVTDFLPIFIPWFWQEEYRREVPENWLSTENEIDLQQQFGLTNEQLVWRRHKIADLSINGIDGEKAFCQEYPCNAAEAFQLTGEDSYIPSEMVMRARKTKAEKFGALVIGVDPARFGDDRTSIILRQGRVAYGLQSYIKKDTMEVAGIVNGLILLHKPAKVFVDIGGLGAGVVDRLHEIGYRDIVVGINAGASPLDPNKYVNKRAEMWGNLKLWLDELPCELPDSDSLQSDLCGIKYTFDSNSRLAMESKDTMKKRGIRSPDEAEALIQTFALPPTAFEINRGDEKVKQIAEQFNQRLAARSAAWSRK